MIIPSYPFSQSSSPPPPPPPMPIDLNIEDQSHDLIFSPTHQPSSSNNSSLSSSYPNFLFNPSHHDHHAGSSSYYWEPNHFQTQEHLQGEKIDGGRGISWEDPHPAADKEEGERKRGLKLKVWKKRSSEDHDNKELQEEDHQNQKKINSNDNHEPDHQDNIIDDSVKWMPSKMRMMRKMMANSVSDQKGSHKFEDQNQNQKQQALILMSPIGTDNSSSNSCSNNNISVRVCADCHTTKTPLWRSGPRGPKSLCNACGIRQRKARRAMAAAAVENGSAMAMETLGCNKFERKEKRSSEMECERELKKKKRKKRKHNNNNNNNGGEGNKDIGIRGRNKFRFEDLAVRLSKKLGPLSQVFPQDEKEAAILLMALSYNYNMDEVHFSDIIN